MRKGCRRSGALAGCALALAVTGCPPIDVERAFGPPLRWEDTLMIGGQLAEAISKQRESFFVRQGGIAPEASGGA